MARDYARISLTCPQCGGRGRVENRSVCPECGGCGQIGRIGTMGEVAWFVQDWLRRHAESESIVQEDGLGT